MKTIILSVLMMLSMHISAQSSLNVNSLLNATRDDIKVEYKSWVVDVQSDSVYSITNETGYTYSYPVRLVKEYTYSCCVKEYEFINPEHSATYIKLVVYYMNDEIIQIHVHGGANILVLRNECKPI